MTLTPLETPKWDAKDLSTPKYIWVNTTERSEENVRSLKKLIAQRSAFLEIKQQMTELCHYALAIFQGHTYQHSKMFKLVLLPTDYRLLEKISPYRLGETSNNQARIDGLFVELEKTPKPKKNPYDGLFLSDAPKTEGVLFEKNLTEHTLREDQENKKPSPHSLSTIAESLDGSKNQVQESKVSSGTTSTPLNTNSDLSRDSSSDIKSASTTTESAIAEQKSFLTQFLPTTIEKTEQITSLTEIVFLKQQPTGILCSYYTASKPTVSEKKGHLDIESYIINQRPLDLENHQLSLFPFSDVSEEKPIQITRQGTFDKLFGFVSKIFDTRELHANLLKNKYEWCFNDLRSFELSLTTFVSGGDSKAIFKDYQLQIAAYDEILDFIYSQVCISIPTSGISTALISDFQSLCHKSGLFLTKSSTPPIQEDENDAYLLLTATTPAAFKELYKTYVQSTSLGQQLNALNTYRVEFNKRYQQFIEKEKKLLDPVKESQRCKDRKLQRLDYLKLEALIDQKNLSLVVMKTFFPEITISYSFYSDLILHAGNNNLQKFAEAYYIALMTREYQNTHTHLTHMLILFKIMRTLEGKIDDHQFTTFFKKDSSDPKREPKQLKLFISLKIKEFQTLFAILKKLPLSSKDLVQFFPESKLLTSLDNSDLVKIAGIRSMEYTHIHFLAISILTGSMIDFQSNYDNLRVSYPKEGNEGQIGEPSDPMNSHRILIICLELLNKIQPFNKKLPGVDISADDYSLFSKYLLNKIQKTSPALSTHTYRAIEHWLKMPRTDDPTGGRISSLDAMLHSEHRGNLIPILKEIYTDLVPNHRLTQAIKKSIFSFLLGWHETFALTENRSQSSFYESKKNEGYRKDSILQSLLSLLELVKKDIEQDPYLTLRALITEHSLAFRVQEFKKIQSQSLDSTDPYCSITPPSSKLTSLSLTLPTELSIALLFANSIDFEIYFQARFPKSYSVAKNDLNNFQSIVAHLSEKIQLFDSRIYFHKEKNRELKNALLGTLKALNIKLGRNSNQEEMFIYLRKTCGNQLNKHTSLIADFLRFREELAIHQQVFTRLQKIKDDLTKMYLLTALTLAKSLKLIRSKTRYRLQELSKPKSIWQRLGFFNDEEHLPVAESSQTRSSSEWNLTRDPKTLTKELMETQQQLDDLKQKSGSLTMKIRPDVKLRIENHEKKLKLQGDAVKKLQAELNTKSTPSEVHRHDENEDDELENDAKERGKEEIEREIDKLTWAMDEDTRIAIIQLQSILFVCNELDIEMSFTKLFKHEPSDRDKKHNLKNSVKFGDELDNQRQLNNLMGI